MSQTQFFKAYVNERLSAAGEEIFRLFEQTVLRYEEEINRQQRLLSSGLLKPKPHIPPQRTEIFAGAEEQLNGQSWQQLQQQQQKQQHQQQQQKQQHQQQQQQQQQEHHHHQQQPETCVQTKSTEIQTESNLIAEQKEELSVGEEEQQQQLMPESDVQKSDHLKDQTPFVRSLVCTTKDDPAGNVSLVVIKAESVHEDDYCGDDFSKIFENNDGLKEESESTEITSMNLSQDEHFQCHLCPETFPDFATCQIHMWSHGGDKVFCSSNLEPHMKIHTDEKPHTCNICGKGFIRDADLTRHYHYHTHTGTRPFPCGVCGKAFNSSSNRFTHMKTHSNYKPHVCPTCGKCFSRGADLRRHLRSHTGEKPYRCKYCSQEFPYHTSLKNHLLTHTGEKQYVCMWCGKRFALKSSLKTHIRVHTGEKPYKCNECGKSFSNSTSLSVHRITHTRPARVTNCV